jgi:hypothetical protein
MEYQNHVQDTADGIANELLSAGLIVGDDLVAMAGRGIPIGKVSRDFGKLDDTWVVEVYLNLKPSTIIDWA